MQRFLILLLVAASAAAQEIPVSDPTFEAQPVQFAAVAASGDRFINVWSVNGVFASVTDLNGTLLRGPVTIAMTGGLPAIATGSNGSLIAWLDGNSAYTAIIDSDGNVSAPALLTTGTSLSGPLSVVWNGSRFLVLLRGPQLTGFLLDANGQRAGDALAIGNYTASATADGSGFLVFAYVNADDAHPEKGATIQARRVESSGSLTPWTQTTTEVTFPRLAAVGRVLFWEYGGLLHRVVTDGNGAPLSSATIFTGTAQQLQKAIAIGSGVLLLLLEPTQQRWSVMLVDAGGNVNAQTFTPPAISDLAAIGSRALLVSAGGTNGVLAGWFVDAPSLAITGPLNLGRMAANQLFPQIASNGSQLLAVWMEPSSGSLFAARIDAATGKHLDGRGILLDSHQLYEAPAVAALGNAFVVAYLEVSSGVAHLMTRRVFPDGTLDAAPTLVSTTAQPFPPRLASDGNQALLVWTENTYKIRGTRISATGAILDPAFLRISDADALPLQFQPDVGMRGDNYLVAWQSQQNQRPTQIRTAAVEVAKSGAVLDPPAAMTTTRYAARVAGDAVAASDGSTAYVNFFSDGSINAGMNFGIGDIEQLDGGYLLVGTESTGFNRPTRIAAAVISADNIIGRFYPIPSPASADQPSLTKSGTGVALTYIRATYEEGFGGSTRAYVLPLNGQRRRPAPPAR